MHFKKFKSTVPETSTNVYGREKSKQQKSVIESAGEQL